MAAEEGARAKGVKRLVKLEEDVVNKIAAGEVIQRPHNALKEIIENAIDAGASRISVVVRDGGNRSIQVQDDGHGIHREDLPLLCERHTTSKLKDFEDLRTIDTLGFRGEALCSISYVSHLTVTTMTVSDAHATKTVYRDSRIDEGPKACAGLVGTTICVEDLFYNVPIRKKALKSNSEELAKVLEVVGRYAVYHNGVGVTLKRYGQQRPDISTNAKDSRLDKLRMLFGSQVGSNLLEFQASEGKEEEEEEEGEGEGNVNVFASKDDEPKLSYKAEGFASSANYSSGKRTVMILFINGRLVECTPLKRCLETIYASVLPKSSKPFFYISIQMPPEHIDVNVHPTKKEVHFLHQDEMVESIRESIEQVVFSSNDHRTYYKQTLLPGASTINLEEGGKRNHSAGSTKRDRAGGDYKLVRTDAHEKKLETFFFTSEKNRYLSDTQASQESEEKAVKKAKTNQQLSQISLSQFALPTPQEPPERETQRGGRGRGGGQEDTCTLTSVKELLDEAFVDTHRDLSDILKSHVYVGMADDKHALLQYKTKLFLLNVKTLSKDMFYQQTLKKFGRLPKLRFAEPLCIRSLVMLALEEEERNGNFEEETDGEKEEAAQLVVDLLTSKREMLEEYFSISINDAAGLTAIPLIVEKQVPDMTKLPKFLLDLGHDVEWEEEKPCFRDIADGLSELFCCEGASVPESRQTDEGEKSSQEELKEEEGHIVKMLLCMRTLLKPSAKRATDATVVQVASLERLYKIFERC